MENFNRNRPAAPRQDQTPGARRPFFGEAPLSLSQHKREVDKRSRPPPTFDFLPKSPPRPACAANMELAGDISTPIFGAPGFQAVAPQSFTPLQLPRPTFHHHHHHLVGSQPFAPIALGGQFRQAAPSLVPYHQNQPRPVCPLHQQSVQANGGFPSLQTMDSLQTLSKLDDYCPPGMVRTTENQIKFDNFVARHMAAHPNGWIDEKTGKWCFIPYPAVIYEKEETQPGPSAPGPSKLPEDRPHATRRTTGLTHGEVKLNGWMRDPAGVGRTRPLPTALTGSFKRSVPDEFTGSGPAKMPATGITTAKFGSKSYGPKDVKPPAVEPATPEPFNRFDRARDWTSSSSESFLAPRPGPKSRLSLLSEPNSASLDAALATPKKKLTISKLNESFSFSRFPIIESLQGRHLVSD